ncbi:helix-turn-helix domain-containing protein [Nocardia transvalensis]|uniref:helix-turn-helix domain-containing protein n=1 Tax=Nocardia transvalensis TaxID=37333 RepID=UPI001895B3D2|nr:helix-turn-helix transcriptional regulator [Nocardia transvalensis]MBF6333373.1 helix-turn-helix transcriptional regulator [Nocardia transvalensis]
MERRARLRSRTALRDVMQARQMSVRTLAHRAGCGKSMIGLLRSGARTSCSADLAVRITTALSMPADDVFILDPEGAEALTRR